MADGVITIFHNPRCSKSREALALVRARDAPCATVEYLESPPDRATLEALVARLDGSPAELVRTGDAGFAELGTDSSALTAPETVVNVLLAHPELMQRPLVVRGDSVVIGRPPERVAQLLD